MQIRHSRGKVRREHPAAWVFLFLGVASLLFSGIAYGAFSLSDGFADGVVEKLEASAEKPTETPPPVQQVALTLSPAATFFDQMKAFAPEGYPLPSAQMEGTASSPLDWTCGISVSPTAALGVELDLQNGATAVVQAFGAGQSAVALDSYKRSVANCARRDGSGGISSRSSAIDGTQGFVAYTVTNDVRRTANVWVRGDVIITVSSPDINVTNDLAAKYDGAVLNALTATTCAAVDVTPEDSTRSPYYDLNTYTGWQRGREVVLGDAVPTLTPGTLSTTTEVVGSGDRLGMLAPGAAKPSETPIVAPKPVSLPKAPEAPIEPAGLPAAVPLPGAAPAAPAAAPLSTVIPERVRDEVGPGCGWAWTGQAPPVYDDSVEKQRADAEQVTAQENLRAGYAAYLSGRAGYLDAYMSYASAVTSYSQYVEQVNAVAAQWDYINTERAKYRRALDNYYAAIAAREKFFVDRQAAQGAYDALVQQCAAQDATRGTVVPEPTPAPTPTPVPTPAPTPTVEPTAPPEPEEPKLQCPPSRPGILDQKEPAEPTPPAKPDVPLPASWTDIP